jgi:ketosteroid isomerase-like protein
MGRRVRFVAWVLLSTGFVGVASAQKPGDELPTGERVRYQYLAETLGQVKEFLVEWRNAQAKRDVKSALKLFTDDALFSPVDGWYVRGGTELTDSLTARLPRQQGYYTTLIDFSASSALAYCLGKVRYVLSGEGEPRAVTATFTMVLFLDGRRWKIRSYLERSEL